MNILCSNFQFFQYFCFVLLFFIFAEILNLNYIFVYLYLKKKTGLHKCFLQVAEYGFRMIVHDIGLSVNNTLEGIPIINTIKHMLRRNQRKVLQVFVETFFSGLFNTFGISLILERERDKKHHNNNQQLTR